MNTRNREVTLSQAAAKIASGQIGEVRRMQARLIGAGFTFVADCIESLIRADDNRAEANVLRDRARQQVARLAQIRRASR